MKIVNKNLEKGGAGRISLIPENSEDMWHAYNIITKNDTIQASTIRKVRKQTKDESSSSCTRVFTMLTIEVETIDFDVQVGILRLKGRNVEENQYVKKGGYHTVDIELHKTFSLSKTYWDSIALERIKMACDPSKNADVAAVIMQEGLANVCLVTGTMTIVRAKVEVTIPHKKKVTSGQETKTFKKFFDTVLQAILRNVNFEVTRCVLLASPGLLNKQFFDYMIQWASKSDNRMLLANKSKFLLVHSSSGFKHSLKEVLADPAVKSKMANTKAIKEVTALDHFYSVLQKEPSRAFYGLRHILKANESKAIDSLLLTDNLFRAQSIEERKKYVELVESVRDNGGEVLIFSSLHVSGEQLMQLTGVAAVLRFAMPELENELSDSDVDFSP